MMTGMELMEQLRTQLLDQFDEVWDKRIKESFVNEAMNAIVLLRPDSTATATAVSLTPGTPKQSIPSDGNRFLSLVRNINGRAITEIDKKVLGATVPGWSAITGDAIEYYMFEPEVPTVYWVFPVPRSHLSVELTYSRPPVLFREENPSINFPEIFIPPIVEYVMYRCLSMNSAGQYAQKATLHLHNFYAALGKKMESDIILARAQNS